MKVLSNPVTQITTITLVFFVVACINVGSESLWLDEAESWLWSSSPINEIPTIASESNHAPAYYIVLSIWRSLGNDSEAWLRALSASFMAGTIPVVYLLGRTVHSHQIGLFSSLAFASSPYIFRFAQEARPYAMLTFLCGVAILCVAIIIKSHIINNRRHDIATGALWTCAIIFTLLAMATHHSAILFSVILIGSYLLIILIYARRGVPQFVYAGAFVSIVGILYCVLLLPLFLTSIGIFNQEPVNIRAAIFLLADVYGGQRILFVALIIAPVVVSAFLAWYKNREWMWIVFFIAMWLGMVAIVVFLGIVHDSIFKQRLFIWTIVPFAIIVGLGLAQLWKPHYWMIALILVNTVGVVLFIQSDEKQPWRDIAASINEKHQVGDVVLVCPWYGVKSLAYYWQDGDIWGHRFNEIKQESDIDVNVARYWRDTNGYKHTDVLGQYKRIWVVRVDGTERYNHCMKHFKDPIEITVWPYVSWMSYGIRHGISQGYQYLILTLHEGDHAKN